MSVPCSAPLSLVIGFEMTSSFLPGLIPINRTTSRTPVDGRAGQICVWLLAARQVFSLLLFLFPVCKKLLALVSFTPHCSLLSGKYGRWNLLISGWLLISNHEPLLDCFLPFGRIALRHAPWARKWTRKTLGSLIAMESVGYIHF